MSINAKFTADFSSFFDAVSKAEVSLGKFDKASQNTGAALSKMVDSFSGRKIIQDATLMAEVFNRAGDSAKFTESELAKMGATGQAAIQKLSALGLDVSPKIQAMADAAKEAAKETGGLAKSFENVQGAIESPMNAATTAVKGLASSLGPAGAAAVAITGTLIAAGTAAFELAEKSAAIGGKLNDMSQKTGIAVPSLSKLSNAAQVAGTDIDALSNAVFMMDKRMADSPKQFEEGLNRLGISFKDFLALSPEDRLLAITNGLRGMTDASERNAAGSELMGRSFRDLGPSLLKLNEALEKTSGLSIWTEEQAKQAEEFEMQLATLKLQFQDVFVSVGRDLIPVLVSFGDVLKDVAKGMTEVSLVKPPETWTAFLLNFLTPAGLVKDVTHAIGVEASWADTALGLLFNGLGKLPPVLGDVDHVMNDAEKRLQDFIKAANTPTGFTQSLDDLEVAWKAETRENTEAVAALKKSNEEAKKWAAVVADVESAGSSWVDTLNKMNKATVDTGLRLLQQGIALKTVQAYLGLTETEAKALENQYKFLNQALADTNKAFNIHNSIMGLIAPRYSAAHEYITGLTNDQSALSATVYDFGLTAAPVSLDALGRMTNAAKKAGDQLGEMRAAVRDAGDALRSSFTNIPSTLTKAFEGGGDLIGALKSIAVQIGDAIAKSISVALSKTSEIAVAAGTSIAGAVGAATGGNAAAAVGSIAASFGGLAVAAIAAHSGIILSSVALGAWTAGIGLAAVGVYLLAKHFLSVSQNEKDARKAFEDFGKAIGTKNVDEFIDRAAKAYAALGKSGVEAQQDIAAALDATHVSAAAEAAALLKIAQVIDAADAKVKRFNDSLKDMQQNGGDNFNAMATALAGDASSLDLLGATALSTFAILVAGGATTTQALTAIAPGLEALQKSFDDLGLNIDDAGVAALIMQENILKNNPAAIAGIDALAASMEDLDGLGLESVETFQKQEQAGLAMYARLQAAAAATGGDTKDALLPMQKYLHDAAAEADKLGVPLDENTQLLIDQSKELGIWKEAGVSAAEQNLEAMQALVAAVNDLITELRNIPTDIRTNVTVTTTHQSGDGAAGMADGGIIHAARGVVLPFPGRPRGTDTVPIWATPGEAVLSRKAVAKLGVNTINRLNAGGGMGGQIADINALRHEQATTNAHLVDLRQDLKRDRRDLPRTLARALRDTGMLLTG